MRPGLAVGIAGQDWRRLAWRHPEWWSLALSAGAWLLLVTGAGFGVSHLSSDQGAAAVPAADHQHVHGATESAVVAGEHGFGWFEETSTWSLMVVAMMVPLVLGPIVTTATRSLWRRRTRAMLGFLTGYLGLWLVAGAAFLGLIALSGADRWLRTPGAVVGGFAIAAAWQLTPLKRRALRACHRTAPLAPRGWRADRDCLRYGWMIGARCLVSCWALMMACVLAGHSLPVMTGVGIIGLAERYRPRPDQRVNAALLSGLAVVYVTGAIG